MSMDAGLRRLTPIALALVVSVAAPLQAIDITHASVVAEMNRVRAHKGLPPLRADSRLDAAAGDRMRDMEELSYWAHDSPDGRSPFTWIESRRYSYRSAAENLAAGFETVELLVSSWMESPGHRANIVSAVFEDCGIAVIDGSTMGRAAGRSVVVLFGRPQTNSH